MRNRMIFLYMTVLLLQVENICSTNNNEVIFRKYPINTGGPNSIWNKVVKTASKDCGGIHYSDGFQIMCLPELRTDSPCDIESKRIDMKDHKGNNLKITIKTLGDSCADCTGNPNLKLLVYQHVGKDTHYNDNLVLESNTGSIVLEKKEGLDAITITLSIARICKEMEISISSTGCIPKGKFKDLIILPSVTMPAPSEKILNCSENALVKIKPQFKCFSNGTYEVVGSCQCKENYELGDNPTTCQPCDSTSYKFNAGNEKCTRCMTGSTFNKEIKKCSCKPGYARFLDDLKEINAKCYGKPRFVKLQKI